MKPVPRPANEDGDSITELKRQNEAPIIKKEAQVGEKAKETGAKENGYLTVLKNIPFVCVMLANLPAVMGLYIPYMFLPGVSTLIKEGQR